ncbi:hypothetical protein [Roseibium denhamense]|uniref:hypothetical protein n=1 Tax=Roseibium denhamense TaxID=76305 RepID=UPI0031D41D41
MFHTADIFETRARAERHQELRRLISALSSFLKRRPTGKNGTSPDPLACANDIDTGTLRAA